MNRIRSKMLLFAAFAISFCWSQTGLDPAIVAPGHGRPLSGAGLPEEFHTLAEHFDAIAVPENQKGNAA